MAASRLSSLPASSLLRLSAPDGATAAVHLHGATVVSWVPSASVGERLFVSSAAALDGSAPVRGGIPLAFPRFAAGLPSRAASAGTAMPFHGFARNADWRVVASAPGSAELALDGDAAAAAAASVGWPHAYSLRLVLSFDASSLTTSLHIANPAGAPSSFYFEALQHTYLAVGAGAAGDVRLDGLAGLTFADKTAGGARAVAGDAPLALAGEVDRIFVTARGAVAVRGVRRADGALATVTSRADGARRPAPPALSAAVVRAPLDVVVWNPGAERARGIKDLGDGEWRDYVCVEPGRVSEDTAAAGELAPGEEFTLRQTLEVGGEGAAL